MTITEFLLARIAEDEEVARAAAEDGGGEAWQISVAHGAMVQLNDGTEWGGETVVYDEGRPGDEQAVHIARHDPERVLAECKAKRQAIDAAWADHVRIEGEWGMGQSRAAMDAKGDVPDVVTALASVYADHPDYREEWQA